MKRILIVEDEEPVSESVASALRSAGFVPTVAVDGRTGFDYAMAGEFDLLILDIGLPDIDGVEVLKRLRAAGNRVPVVTLTGCDVPADTVACLPVGADDGLVKPVRVEDLLSRVRLRLGDPRASDCEVLSYGTLSLDLRTRRAEVGLRTVALSRRECALAEAFLRHPGQVLSRRQLLSHVWGSDVGPRSNVVDVYIGYLRQKLGPGRIQTVRGVGYRLVDAP